MADSSPLPQSKDLKLVTTLPRFQGLISDRYHLRIALMDLVAATDTLLDSTVKVKPAGHFAAWQAWTAAKEALDLSIEEDKRQAQTPAEAAL